jgi:hypothetical protein
VDVEGPGNGADRLPVSDEFPGQFLLVWAHFLGSVPELYAAPTETVENVGVRQDKLIWSSR